MVVRGGQEQAPETVPAPEQEQDEGHDSEESEETWPAEITTGTEQGAVGALAAVWAAATSDSGEPPVPDGEIRSLIKEYNELIPELCPVDGTVSKASMKVQGTQGSDGEGPATMRIRLAKALLRLTRLDSSNYEAMKENFEAALWLRRCRMEVLLRGRAPPSDDTGMEGEMLGEHKDIEWKVLWPAGWGSHDRHHSKERGQAAPRGQATPTTCPHGKVGPCPQCELQRPWGSPGSDKAQKRVRLQVHGQTIEFCQEHKVGYDKGDGCPGCEATAAQKATSAGAWLTCDKHGKKVYFQGRCELCRAGGGSGGGSRSSGGTVDSALSDKQSKGELTDVQRMQVMAKVMTKAIKGSAKKKKKTTMRAPWAESSSSGSDSEEESDEEGILTAPSVRRQMKELCAEDTLREMSTHARPQDYTLSALGGYAAHWGEDFNARRQENEDIRNEVMALGRKIKDEKSTQRLAGMAVRLKYMKKRWAENHERMELLRKAIDESGTGASVAVHIMQEVQKGKRKRGYAEAEWVKAKKKVVGKQASNNINVPG